MKCPDCPVNPPLSCLGESHKPLCGQLHDPGRIEQLKALAEGREYIPAPYVVPRETFPPGPDPADWVPSVEAPPHAPPPWMADAPIPVDTSREVEAHLSRFFLMSGCDYLGPRITGCGCGSSARVCFAGKGREPGRAFPGDCIVCVGDYTAPGGPLLD